MRSQLLLALSLLAAPAVQAQQPYGFIARLGRDTISVERVTRTAQRVVIDQVEHAPRVIQRHLELTLAPGGTVREMTPDITTPNAAGTDPRSIHVTASFGRDSVRVTHRTDAGTRTVTLPNSGYLTMPWSTHLYASYELLMAAALKRRGGTTIIRQFIPGRLLLDEGTIRNRGGGKAEITSTALAGFGQATLDAQGRMRSYSGARTTYLVEVERLATAPDVQAIAARFAATEKANPYVAMLSIRGTTKAQIGKATLTVDYGRPLVRGRQLLGGIIPYDQVWRTGANAATQFTTTAKIKLSGLELAPGTYTLWTLPTRGGVQLIVNKQFGQWGTSYDASQDLGHVPLIIGRTKSEVERFTISIEPTGKSAGALILEWGPFHWTASIVVD